MLTAAVSVPPLPSSAFTVTKSRVFDSWSYVSSTLVLTCPVDGSIARCAASDPSRLYVIVSPLSASVAVAGVPIFLALVSVKVPQRFRYTQGQVYSCELRRPVSPVHVLPWRQPQPIRQYSSGLRPIRSTPNVVVSVDPHRSAVELQSAGVDDVCGHRIAENEPGCSRPATVGSGLFD